MAEAKAGAGYDGGRWFAPEATNEMVMGYEVAEYEQRKVGDTFYASIVPNGKTEPELHAFTVVGVLERTGAQDDGTVFLPLARGAGRCSGAKGELTIIGIKLREFNGIRMREFEGRWLKIPEVQVVSLEQVKGALVSLVGTAQTMVAAVASSRSGGGHRRDQFHPDERPRTHGGDRRPEGGRRGPRRDLPAGLAGDLADLRWPGRVPAACWRPRGAT